MMLTAFRLDIGFSRGEFTSTAKYEAKRIILASVVIPTQIFTNTPYNRSVNI